MKIPEDFIQVKEYDNYILFEHKTTKIKECFLKVDLGLIPVVYTGKDLRERRERRGRRKKRYDPEL